MQAAQMLFSTIAGKVGPAQGWKTSFSLRIRQMGIWYAAERIFLFSLFMSDCLQCVLCLPPGNPCCSVSLVIQVS